MSERYTHRNGETEPPTVHEGYYWFDADEHAVNRATSGCYYIMPASESVNGIAFLSGEDVPINVLKGRWWGPVTPPWEQGA